MQAKESHRSCLAASMSRTTEDRIDENSIGEYPNPTMEET